MKKIWETQRWTKRYTKKYYEENNIEMVKTWDVWTKLEIRKLEKDKIINYELNNGKKPPLNKAYH